MRERKVLIFLLLFWWLYGAVSAQNAVVVSGMVADTAGVAIPDANILAEGTGKGATTDADGLYKLTLTSGKPYILAVSHVGYAAQRYALDLSGHDVHGSYEIDFTLHDRSKDISEVVVTAGRAAQGTLQRIETGYFRQLPNPSGSFEALLKTLPGVSSSNELSSQYSVRGGNFDENLVYVNGIEIHRPMLVRSGQQEGLSFINPDLVESVDFSAGGFDARFGDKMSSVLDVHYRTPEKFAGSASLSLLGASASVEGLAAGHRLSYLAGVRYKTPQYLLGTLDTKGQYNPDFFDMQSLLTYRLSESWNVELLANIARNRYLFIPETRNTNFGTLYNAYNLRIYYDGREADRYASGTGALTFGFHPSDRLSLKFTASTYLSHEQEAFDIEGSYLLNVLDAQRDSTLNIGAGSELSHARNYLNTRVGSVSHAGNVRTGNGSWQWSIGWQREIAADRMNEWAMLDSAGYSVPYNGKSIQLQYARHADNRLAAHRLASSLQYTRRLTGNRLGWTVTAGLRLGYSGANREWMLSPRASVTVRPLAVPNLTAHIAGGLYGQPPAYREMRDTQGRMNTEIKAQRSIHYVAGADYTFRIGQLPFKLSTELYCKQLSRLIPYKIENVRIYYAGDNLAKGYIAGWDIKLNGEFVEGAESWISLSLMHAREKLEHGEHGRFPFPTDQLANFNLFFQDYIPGEPTWRAYLNMVFSAPLPCNYPVPDHYDLTFRMPAYRRVDIGFSKEFFKKERPHGFLKQMWLNAEIFNLFDTGNTVSYLWIQVVANRDGLKQQYAVPNYLTGRRINVKLTADF